MKKSLDSPERPRRGLSGFMYRAGATMFNVLDLRWLLLIPALLALGFLAWVFVSFSRDRAKYRERDALLASRRRNKSGIWE
jgi:hypothetical protein